MIIKDIRFRSHHIFAVTVEDFQMTNEHAYMEVSLSDKSGAVIPLELYQHNIIGRDQQKDRSADYHLQPPT